MRPTVSGFYDIPLTLTADGTFAITSRASTTAGNSPLSAALNVTVDTAAPTIGGGVYDREVTQDIGVNVSDARASKLNWSAAVLTNLTTGASGPAVQSFFASPDGSTGTLAFTTLFADGNYRLTFPLGSVTDIAGNQSAAYSITFTQLAGDANNDGTVNFDDLIVLAQHYNTAGNTFSTGNFDYSAGGTVNFDDLILLAQRYNTTLPPPSVAASVIGTASTTKTKKRPEVLVI